MTYTIRRYRSYQEYLDDGELQAESKNYRLLDTGELVEVAREDDTNIQIVNRLIAAILQVMGIEYLQQYQALGIDEYWIADPHRAKVTVLILVDGEYQESVYVNDDRIVCAAYPTISLTADELLFGTR